MKILDFFVKSGDTDLPRECRSVQDRMFEELDGEASPALHEKIEAHLASCEVCKKEMESRRAMLAAIRASAERPPESLKDSVMAHLDENAQGAAILSPIPKKKKAFIPVGTIAAACIVAVMFLGSRGLPWFRAADNISKEPSLTPSEAFDAAMEQVPEDMEITVVDGGKYGAVSETAEPESAKIVYSAAEDGRTAPFYPDTKSGKALPLQALLDAAADRLDGDWAIVACPAGVLDSLMSGEGEALTAEGCTAKLFGFRAKDAASALNSFTGALTLLERAGVSCPTQVPGEGFTCWAVVIADGQE